MAQMCIFFSCLANKTLPFLCKPVPRRWLSDLAFGSLFWPVFGKAQINTWIFFWSYN